MKAEWGSLSRGDRELTLGGTGTEKGSGEGGQIRTMYNDTYKKMPKWNNLLCALIKNINTQFKN